MARLVRDCRLESRDARLRLKKRKEPYWRLISEGIHLGYYRGDRGGVWHARVRSLDGTKYIKSAITDADDYADSNGDTVLNFSQAQESARKIADRIRRDVDDINQALTIKEAVSDYLADFKANGKKSLYSTETQINAHIIPYFGAKLVSALTFNQLNTWKNNLATTDKRARSSKKITEQQKYTPAVNNDDPEYLRRRRATANRIITILKAILNHAYNTNRTESNEAWQKLKPFKNVSEAKIRFLSEAESLRLMHACEPSFRSLVRGALLSGARYGELTKLKVGDYNVDSKTLFIHQSKSGKPRHIPLNQEGINFFTQLTIGRASQDFIFTRSDGVQWKKSYQARPLEAACIAAKISPIVTFHHLRHTYASALAQKGVPLQVIAAVLGHSDTRVTHKHYAHLMPSYIADVIKENLPDFGKTEIKNISKIKAVS